MSVISLGSGLLKPVLIFLKNKKVNPKMVKWDKDNYIYYVIYIKFRDFNQMKNLK